MTTMIISVALIPQIKVFIGSKVTNTSDSSTLIGWIRYSLRKGGHIS